MTQPCDSNRPLISRYLDGELLETEAGPLRRHLLACQGCRTATQGDKALRRWFQAEAQVPVPQGFASRVARLAFAGALPGDGAASSIASPAPSRHMHTNDVAATAPSALRDERILPFVLRMTAAAALLLIVLSGFMREVHIATVDDLSADDATVPTLEELDSMLERLDENATVPGAPAR